MGDRVKPGQPESLQNFEGMGRVGSQSCEKKATDGGTDGDSETGDWR